MQSKMEGTRDDPTSPGVEPKESQEHFQRPSNQDTPDSTQHNSHSYKGSVVPGYDQSSPAVVKGSSDDTSNPGSSVHLGSGSPENMGNQIPMHKNAIGGKDEGGSGAFGGGSAVVGRVKVEGAHEVKEEEAEVDVPEMSKTTIKPRTVEPMMPRLISTASYGPVLPNTSPYPPGFIFLDPNGRLEDVPMPSSPKTPDIKSMLNEEERKKVSLPWVQRGT